MHKFCKQNIIKIKQTSKRNEFAQYTNLVKFKFFTAILS